MIDLSIIIPCYNEENRIRDLLKMLEEFSVKWENNYELIFVDDGSEKPINEIINAWFEDKNVDFSILRLKENQGKGAALKEGVEKAKYDFILTVDADGSYNPLQIKEWIIENQGKGPKNEIWIGSRMHDKSKMEWEEGVSKKEQRRRKNMGFGYNAYIKMISNIDCYDTQSGFKLYPKDIGKFLFKDLKDSSWAHDVSLLYKAQLNDIEIVEQPVYCIHKMGSKVHLKKDTIVMFFQTLKTSIHEKWKHFFVIPFQAAFQPSELKAPSLEKSKKYRRESIFRGLFVLFSLFLLLFMPWISKDFAIAGDEWIQNEYGKEIYNYFAHGDPRAYQEVGRIQNYDAIVYYSGGYELLLITIAKWFPNAFEYDIRHFLVAFTGAWFFIFTGLFGKRLGGWIVGFFSLFFIALSPRLFGEAMNNSKDIPFALGVVFTLYHMIPFLKKLPYPSWRSVFWITVGLIFTYNIRIGAFLVVGYLGLFSLIALLRLAIKMKKNFFREYGIKVWGQLALKFATILIVSYFLGIITWPWAMQDPIFNPLDSMKQMARFPITLRILFGGDTVNSALIPWTYIPVWMSITNPEIILALFVLGSLGSYWIIKHYKNLWMWILHFLVWFPIVFAILQKSVLYDGWRHFLFLYAPVCIIAASAIGFIYDKINGLLGKAAVIVVIAVGMLFPIKSMFDLHPYEYLYFNHAFGGLQAAHGQYETDYYFSSAKEAIYTLAEKKDFYNLKDSVYIRTNMTKEVAEYAKTISPYIVVDYSKFETRHESYYDFAIYNSRFLDIELLNNNSWPAKNEVYFNVERQGVPLTTVLYKESNEDYLGFLALEEDRIEDGLKHFNNYLTINPEHEGVLYAAGVAAMMVQAYGLAASYLKASIDLYPNSSAVLNYALSQLHNNQPDAALKMLQRHLPKLEKSYFKYRTSYMKDKNDIASFSLMQMDAQELAGYYQMLMESYKMLGNEAKAIEYYKKLEKL